MYTRSAGKDIPMASDEMSTTPIAQQEAKDTECDGSGSCDPSPRQPPRTRKMWTKAEVDEIQDRCARGESWKAISTHFNVTVKAAYGQWYQVVCHMRHNELLLMLTMDSQATRGRAFLNPNNLDSEKDLDYRPATGTSGKLGTLGETVGEVAAHRDNDFEVNSLNRSQAHDDSLLNSLPPTTDSTNSTQGKKRRYPIDESLHGQVQQSCGFHIRSTLQSQALALQLAASYAALGHEKDALVVQFRKLEEEHYTLQNKERALQGQAGKFNDENYTLRERSTAHVKEIDALERQNTIIRDRLRQLEAKESQYSVIDDQVKAADHDIAERERAVETANNERDTAMKALTSERQSHQDNQPKSRKQVSDQAAQIRTLEMEHAAQIRVKEEKHAAQFNELSNDVAALGTDHAAQMKSLAETQAARLNELGDRVKRYN